MAEEATNQEAVVDLKDNEIIDEGPSEIEVEASQKGWKPEKDYDGPAGGFVSAKEFLQREPLFDKIKTQSKELKSLKKTIDALVAQGQSQVEAQVAVRLQQLKEAKTEAIEAGDVAQVNQIDAQIDEQKKVVESTPKLPDEVSSWVADNPWFNSNKEMNAWAIAHNKAYMGNNPNADIADSLVATTEAIKKAFPDQFKAPAQQAAANPVEGASQPADKKGKNNFSVSRLSEPQKLVYNQLVKVHKTISHEDYFKGLEEIGELS